MNTLNKKVAIITGGAGGIGRATGKLFAAEGAWVVLVDMHEVGLKEAVAEIDSEKVSYVVADVREVEQVKGYVDETVRRHGRIDVLFSNAGVEGCVTPIVDYPVEVFDKVVAVNIRGVWLSLKFAMPVMAKQGGGSIIITSSIGGLRGFAGLSAYVTSKHAVVGLMRTAVLEAGASGVRINTIHPSPVETRMMRAIEEGATPDAPAQAKSAFEAMIPAGRYGTPEEVAQLARFLASAESCFCSGGSYTVDGGMAVG